MAKRITIYSLLTLFALAVSYVEGIAFAFVPIPGFKIGIANVVSMYLISKKQFFGGISINFTRIILAALLFGNFYSFIFSLAGGVLSTILVILLSRVRVFSFAGVSCAAGLCHNVAQIIAAAVLTDTLGITSLLPVMMISGAITGFISGTLLIIFEKKYSKILNSIV